MSVESREDKIRVMAYELWEQEGRPEGRDLDHYLQAEKIVTAGEAGPKPAATAKPRAKRTTTRKTITKAKKIA